jgi:hypothetical protein
MPSRASFTEGGPWESKRSLRGFRRRQEEARGRDRGRGRTGEVRFLGDVENSPLPIERTIKRPGGRYGRPHVWFEAGPTRYELYRQIQALATNTWLSLRL